MGVEPEIEEDEIEQAPDSIRGDIEKAIASLEDDGGKPAPEKPKADDKQSPDPKIAKPEEKIPDAPRSWTNEEKTKWGEATPEVRKAILRREQEVELGFTKLDEDRNLGKSLKEVISPYMSIIQAEGGTPQTAVQSLLNTAYILRTAPVAQKTALFHQLAKQYGVDLSIPSNPSAAQPDALAQTQQQLHELRQQIQQQPEVFRQQQENLVIKSQIDAFAADPKNVHYEKLKPVMAALLQSGQAEGMQDAYDKASWADPDIRSANLTAETQTKETQRLAEIKAKADKSRRASVSIKGSPSVNPVANGNANSSIRDDLEAAFAAHT